MDTYVDHLVEIVHRSPTFMSQLRAVRDLKLASWCIGAGAVRNMVWDALHGFEKPSVLPDVDVAYFDTSNLAAERDEALQENLATVLPDTPWEVTNQAAVHLWFEAHFGHAVAPLVSLEEAVASWPEYATSVGLLLDTNDQIQVIAPHGLSDLFSMTVRRNPTRVSVETYGMRCESKRYTQRWPKVTVVPSGA
jgi:uncharacterized protein